MNVRTKPTLTGMLAVAAAGIFAAGTIGGWANTLYGASDGENAPPAPTPAQSVSEDEHATSDPAG